MSDDLPPAPVNLRFVHEDGTTVPLECTYVGPDEEGLHVWQARPVPGSPPLQLDDGMPTILADLWPAQTSIAFRLD